LAAGGESNRHLKRRRPDTVLDWVLVKGEGRELIQGATEEMGFGLEVIEGFLEKGA
jgi:hypothetical protein